MSTIQSQVRKKVFEKFGIEGFVSLVKSAGLLKKIFEKLGLVEGEQVEPPEENKVDLVFGNATEIFNYHDNSDYYFFALPTENNSSTIAYVRVYHPLMDFEGSEKSTKHTQKLLDFNIIKYYKGKDPPVY